MKKNMNHDEKNPLDCSSSPCRVQERSTHTEDTDDRRTGCGCGHDHADDHQHDQETHDHQGHNHEITAESCACSPAHDAHAHHGHSHEIEIDGCGCDHGHDHGDSGEELKSKPFLFGVVLFVLTLLLSFGLKGQVGAFGPLLNLSWAAYLPLVGFLISYLLVAKTVLLTAWNNITKGQVFDENFLMAIASIGAFLIGEYPEAVAVILFYQVGEYVQGRAVANSKKSISQLMDIRPDTANRKTAQGIETVAAELVRVGEIIVVKPGEKVPLDGEVIEGTSSLDMKALTGESLPVDVSEGMQVLSGSINGQGLLTMKVGKAFSESTVSKIIELVQNAVSKKAKTENFISKFARYYTPAVVGVSAALALIPPFVLQMGPFSDWLYRALVFLVISCPCALVISIPLGFFGGIGASSAKGILVKGGNYLEALNNVDCIVFDKTGTLTNGVFQVKEILPQEGFTQDQVLEWAAYAESHSTHPIAVSIKKMYEKEQGKVDEGRIANIEERMGFGLSVSVDGRTVLAGNAKLMKAEGVAIQEIDAAGTLVYIAVDGTQAGAVLIADQPKADSKKAIEGLRGLGVSSIVMLTGDNRKIGEAIGESLGVDETYAELLPHQKVEVLEEVMERNRKARGGQKAKNTIFVGDGINDAPVLARADIGVAMGGVGSDAAIEAADIVIMNDEPSKLITAIMIARKTRRIVYQNISLALGVKAVVLLLGAFGIATMWEAVFADVGVALLAVANAVRAGKI